MASSLLASLWKTNAYWIVFHGNETTLVGDFAFGIMLGSMKVTNVPNLDQSAMLSAQSNMEPHLANANLATMVVDNNIFLVIWHPLASLATLAI